MPSELARTFATRNFATHPLTREEALQAIAFEAPEDLDALYAASSRVRGEMFGQDVSVCTIVNAKSGNCSEDCGFCAQSAHYQKDTGVTTYPLMSAQDIVNVAWERKAIGGREFSIVTSGTGVYRKEEVDTLVDAIKRVNDEVGMESCASLGLMKREDLLRLKEAGMVHFHHNLETAKSHFNNIVTTHTFEDEVETVRLAKELGFEICCGGIFGMGESREQRVELMETLRDLDVDSIPINFLNPLKGTKLDYLKPMPAEEALKVIAVMRLMMPGTPSFVCGGREVTLGERQDEIFRAGASGLMMGNYLTTSNRNYLDDRTMVSKQGLRIKDDGCHVMTKKPMDIKAPEKQVRQAVPSQKLYQIERPAN